MYDTVNKNLWNVHALIGNNKQHDNDSVLHHSSALKRQDLWNSAYLSIYNNKVILKRNACVQKNKFVYLRILTMPRYSTQFTRSTKSSSL